jgi:hypothetical protein
MAFALAALGHPRVYIELGGDAALAQRLSSRFVSFRTRSGGAACDLKT